MSKAARQRLIKRIEKQRKSRIVCYITSTRKGLEVQMAMDAVRKVYEHIRDWKDENIDLFLHSNGGDGTVPWRLVTLIREHAKRFSVLVPHRAFSAATLTALGADSVVMHPMGMLGPTDATVSNAFNPQDPSNPQQRLGISVEDVTAYLALVKDDAGIQHQDELVQAFNILAEKVHPLALGNVKRSLSQSRMMARKLLALHMPTTDEHRINEIVDNLTSKLYYHGHPINRIEAREHVGLGTVEDPPRMVEQAMWELYLEYETEMRLEEPFDAAMEFMGKFPGLAPGAQEVGPKTTARIAFIESTERVDVFEIEYALSGQMQPTMVTNVTTSFYRRGWTTE